MGEMKNAYKILVGKQCKMPVCRYRHRWEDNIKMELKEIRWEGVEWMYLAQDRDQWRGVVNMLMNLRGISSLAE
jgi:hypothetical protein